MADKNGSRTEGNSGGVEIFDALKHKAPPPGRNLTDAAVRYLGVLRLYSTGVDRFQEVCAKRGMVDKARRVVIGWRKQEQQLVLVPAAATDKSAVAISWSSKQRHAVVRMRSAFLHYGIDMLENSVWQVNAVVAEVPGIGWCLTLALADAIHQVEEQKKAAVGQQA